MRPHAFTGTHFHTSVSTTPKCYNIFSLLIFDLNKMASEKSLFPEEIWLQDSEARLESMEIMLKSVRRDIDALSERLPSPRSRPGNRVVGHQEEATIHESGQKEYILRIDDRPKGYHDLGLGSHTTLEPFDDDEDVERSGREIQHQKSWRSPADFRSHDSPPDSPTFGESSNIISLNDVILSTEGSQEGEPSRLIPLLGSQHSLPTIEENSQEDNTDTSSISTAEDLKSADCIYEQRSVSAVCGNASSDTILATPRPEMPIISKSKSSLIEERVKSAQSPLNRSRSQSPIESLRYSRTSLRSRDSWLSEADSFVTVNSQLFQSGEEVYITACSDNDLGESADEARTPSQERTRKKMLVLQQTPPSECQNQSDDVLEFTLVEAPISEMEAVYFEKAGRLIYPFPKIQTKRVFVCLIISQINSQLLNLL